MLKSFWLEVPTQANKHFRLDMRIRKIGYDLFDVQYLGMCKECKHHTWRSNDVDTNAVWVRWLLHAEQEHPDVVNDLGLFVDAATPIYDATAAIAKMPLESYNKDLKEKI